MEFADACPEVNGIRRRMGAPWKKSNDSDARLRTVVKIVGALGAWVRLAPPALAASVHG